MKILVTATMPPLKKGFAKIVKEAMGEGLEEHRTKSLPMHFKTVAFARWPAAYHNSSKRSKSQTKTKKTKQHFKKLSNDEKIKYRKYLQDKKDNKKPSPEPLVQTGLLKDAALHGAGRILGSVKKLTLRISVPAHLNFNNNKFDKKVALTAINTEDDLNFQKIIDKKIDLNWIRKPRKVKLN